MANRGAPHVFQDNREIPQGPQIILRLYSSPDAAPQQQDWLDITSSEQQDRARSPVRHEVDVPRIPPIGLVNRYFVFEDGEVEDSRPRSPTTTWEIPPGLLDGATKVVRLAGVLSPDDLRDDVFYQEVLEDFTVEACKFGGLLEVVIPRPCDPAVSGGVGKVFLKYGCLDASIRCLTSLDGRWFAKRCIVAGYYPEDRFDVRDYGYDGQ